jgi:hypothetical protein
VRFHLDRPVQIESSPASLLFGLGGSHVTGAPVAPDPYKSNGLAGGHADLVLALCTAALVAALLAAIVLAARRPEPRHLLGCSLLALLAFVALGKVLSPQYMIWLAPFAVLALLHGERAIGTALLAAIVLTQLWFPGRYFDLVGEDTAVVAAGVVPFLATGGITGMVRFHLDRPVQIESSPASLLFGLGGSHVTGAPVAPDPYKSNGLAGGHADLVLALCTAALVAALLATVVLAARRPTARHLLGCSLLALLAFVALGKVLSPQYMMWLAPFAVLALLHGERAIGTALLAAIVLTQLWFPGRYFDLVGEDTAIVVLVALRNALLLTALVATARALARSPWPSAAAARSG